MEEPKGITIDCVSDHAELSGAIVTSPGGIATPPGTAAASSAEMTPSPSVSADLIFWISSLTYPLSFFFISTLNSSNGTCPSALASNRVQDESLSVVLPPSS